MNTNQACKGVVIPGTTSQPAQIADFVDNAHPADVAAFIEESALSESVEYLKSVDTEKRADVFSYIELDTQAELSRLLNEEELAQIVTKMARDDRTDLFNELDTEEQQRLLKNVNDEQRSELKTLSMYPEKTAGALMTSAFICIDANLTAKQALLNIRQQAPNKDSIYHSFIVDSTGSLVGQVELHQLVLASDDATVMQIMEQNPVTVTTDESQETVAHIINRYDLTAVAVLNKQGCLMGIVTHDDAADAMQIENTEDFHKGGTVEPLTKSIMKASMGLLYRKRIVWLALLVFGNLFSGAGLAFFEETILAYVSLVFFLPLLIDSSGNAGSQSATLIVRAMAMGDVVAKDWQKLITRELVIALGLGLTMALLVFPIGYMRGGLDVALVVGLTMTIIVIMGSLVGLSLPFLLSKFNLDPATASGPLVTTISDAVGVIIYFSIATAILTL